MLDTFFETYFNAFKSFFAFSNKELLLFLFVGAMFIIGFNLFFRERG